MTIDIKVVVSFLVGIAVYHLLVYPERFKKDSDERWNMINNSNT